MEGSLGKLFVSISADAKELSNGLNQAQKQIQNFQQSANKILGLIGFSLIAAALVDLTKKTIEYGNQLNKMSEQTGLAASEIAKLKYVAEQSDTSLEAVTGTFRFLAKAMNEAKSGNTEAIQTFSRFHVEFQNADGTLRNYKDVMLDVADRIKNTSNESVILAEGQKLLGRNVQQVLPLLKQGASGIAEMTKKYEEMRDRIGLTDTQIDKFAKDSDALGDAWKDLSTAFQFMLIEVLTPLIPKMKELTEKLVNADWESVAEKIGVIVEMFEKLWGVAEKIYNAPWWDELFAGIPDEALGDLDKLGPPEVSALTGEPMGPIIARAKPATTTEGSLPIPMVRLGTIKVGGEGQEGIDQTSSMFDSISAKMKELETKWKDINKQMSDLWGTTMTMIATGFGTSVADMIVDGKDFGESMKELWKDIAKTIIAEIVKIIAQQIILFTWQVMTGTVGSGNIVGGGGGKKFFGLFDKGAFIPQARNGLLYGANGFATTGNMGEGGIPAVVHPGEIVSPIDKFFDFLGRMRGDTYNIYPSEGMNEQALAEHVALENDRRRRRP